MKIRRVFSRKFSLKRLRRRSPHIFKGFFVAKGGSPALRAGLAPTLFLWGVGGGFISYCYYINIDYTYLFIY